MEIIPAIDLIEGRVVRLTQGDYAQQTSYATDPVALAKQFAAAGCTRLHLVDLDGARAGHPINLGVLQAIAHATDLQIDYSGGLRTQANVQAAFDAGAAFVCLGSITVKEPDTVLAWAETLGRSRIILSADVREEQIQTHGWLQTSSMSLTSYIEYYLAAGFTTFCCTDINKDGMLAGPNVGLYQKLLGLYPTIRLIASGGVTTLEQIAALRALGCHGAIVGKALLDGKLELSSLFTPSLS